MARSLDENEDDLIILESSSGDDEPIPSGPSTGSIRLYIEEAKKWLAQADNRSHPNPENVGLRRYGVSSSVNGSDLFRNVEFLEISDLFSSLQTRLSAERIFNLGIPQSPEETLIFDELLMRYSAELLSDSVDSNSRDNVRNHRNTDVNSNRRDREETVQDTSFTMPSARSESLSESNSGRHESRSHERSTENVSPLHFLGAVNFEGIERTGSSDQGSSIPLSPSTSAIPSSPQTPLSVLIKKTVLDHLTELRNFLQSNVHDIRDVHKHVTELSNFFRNLTQSSSDENFTPSKSKRKRGKDEKTTPSPPSSAKKVKHNDSDEEEEACSICFETWSSGGEHRVCCLKCGHLFGMSCITKWIEQAKSCPQCKLPAKKSDIRSIFARRLTVEDTSQKDRALKLLEEERQLKRSLEHKEAMARKNLDDIISVNEMLKSRVSRLESELSSSGSGRSGDAIGTSSSSATSDLPVEVAASSSSVPNKNYQHLIRVNVSQESSCRVFEHNKDLGIVIVSTKSSNPLFRGFGIKTLSRDFRVLSYQPLHSAAIRDMSFRPATYDGTLLSCGMDKVISLTSVTSKCVIQKYTGSGLAWSCAWNTLDTHLFYVGMERGVVKEFDIRRTDSHVQEIVQLGGPPISSLDYWNGMDHESRTFQGLFIGHIRDVIFKGKTDEGFSTHVLHSSHAPVMGLSVHSNGLFLVSNRPGGGSPLCKYQACKLNENVSATEDIEVSSSTVSTWDGGNVQVVMSRNALITMPEVNSHILAATANHSSNTVNLWNVTRRQPFQVVNCQDKALDIKPMHSGNQDLLGVLCDSELAVYKWR